jgi:(5-formylfuran-3-yl)methyl phosphate synthase
MRLLVSVRDVPEALAAAEAGADFIDLKEPSQGALGGLGPARILPIVAALRARWPALKISATVGDLPQGTGIAALQAEALQRVAAVAACGVDYVKVGVAPGQQALLAALAACNAAVVPVLLADDGIDAALVDAALTHATFPALMLDTAEKGAGSLLDRLPHAALAGFVAPLRRRACLSGLAGALREADLPALQALGPDFAGFRSAVCAGPRDGVLDAARVRRLRGLLSRTTEPVRA